MNNRLTFEDVKKLDPGTHVWLVNLKFSSKGRIIKGTFVELELLEKGSDLGGRNYFRFKVSSVCEGSELKVNSIYIHHDYSSGKLFKTIDQGIDWWNYCIRDAEIELSADFKTRLEALNRRLIK